jgi:hypothetical protein
MVAQEARRPEKENDHDKAGEKKSHNCSTRFHRSNDLPAEGLSGRADEPGRAKSPVLNASAVAAVKMSDCVS